MALLPIHNTLSNTWLHFRGAPAAQPSDHPPQPVSFVAPSLFFPHTAQSARTALPVTAPASHLYAETVRRRLKPPTLPSHHHHLNTHYTHTPRRSSPIKVLSMAAVEESRKRTLPKFFTGARGPILAIALHLLIGTVFLVLSEGWTLLDALYFAVVIATTVGYGDITPVNTISKLFVSLYAIVSVAIIANMLQALVERFADAHSNIASSAQKALLRSVTSRTTDPPSALSTSSVLQASDIDFCVATKAAARNARHRLSASIIMWAVACISGAILYHIFLRATLVDVIYFLCVSMTTVGLGDIHPVTRIGKAYAIVWLVLTSLGFANILSQYTNLKVKEREHNTALSIFSGSFGEKMFREIDGDNDGTLSEAEYLGYIICKLGKVAPDEVRSIISRFRDLDRNGSGFITKDEVDLSQKKTT